MLLYIKSKQHFCHLYGEELLSAPEHWLCFSQPTHTDEEKASERLPYRQLSVLLQIQCHVSLHKSKTEVQDDSLLDQVASFHYRAPIYSHSQFCVIFHWPLHKVFQWKVTILFIIVIWRLELSVLVAELHLHLQFCIIDVLIACLCF